MIEVTVVNKEKKQIVVPEYPCLKESDGVVILFTKKDSGIVLVPSKFCLLGHYGKAWDEKRFNPYIGSIAISNA